LTPPKAVVKAKAKEYIVQRQFSRAVLLSVGYAKTLELCWKIIQRTFLVTRRIKRVGMHRQHCSKIFTACDVDHVILTVSPDVIVRNFVKRGGQISGQTAWVVNYPK